MWTAQVDWDLLGRNGRPFLNFFQPKSKNGPIILHTAMCQLYSTWKTSISLVNYNFSFFACSVRRKAIMSRDPIQYCMETDLTFQTIPPHIYKHVSGTTHPLHHHDVMHMCAIYRSMRIRSCCVCITICVRMGHKCKRPTRQYKWNVSIGYTPSPRCATSLYYDYTKF